jgi:hypothetical protein
MSETEVSGGLLDGVSGEENTPDNSSTTSAEAEISHVAADPNAEDDSPLERPDWWPEKFWAKDSNEPELEKLAGAYAELEKKFRNGDHKAPEEYDISGFGPLSTEDPVVGAFAEWSKKYGVSQAAFNEMAEKVMEFANEEIESGSVNLEKERQALGPNADAIVKSMAQWGNGLVAKGIWGPDDFEEFKVWGATASGIKALQKLRATYEGRVPIEAAKPEGMPSKDELYDMVAKPEYKTDPAYRKKVEKLFEQAFGQAA